MTPYFNKTIHRILLEKKLRVAAHLLHGSILDIGSKNRRYDHLFDGTITAVDLVPNPARNVEQGDIEHGLGFPDGSFDGVLCLEVFEYLAHVEPAIEEIFRLLRPGGYLILSVPFLNNDHGDKQRYTKNHLTGLFGKFAHVQTDTFGNGFTLVWDILRKKASRHNRLLRYPVFLLLLPYLLMLKLSSLEKIHDDTYAGLFFIMKKPS